MIAISASVLLMFSCTGSKTNCPAEEAIADSGVAVVDSVPMDSLEQLIVDAPTPKAMDELFDDFVFNFAANKKLQLTRVVFPLSVHKGDKVEQIEKSRWQMERFFMRQGYYTLIFDNEERMQLMKDTSLTQAVVQKIMLKKGIVRDFVFSRIKGAWMLHQINELPIADNPNASFLNFYQHFVADKAFQQQSLNTTVAFVGPDPDDDFKMMEGVITPDTWEAFAPQLPEKVIYNIVYGKSQPAGDEKIFILRGIANGLELELRFKQVNGRWLLMKMST